MHISKLAVLLLLLPCSAQASKIKPFYVFDKQHRFPNGNVHCPNGFNVSGEIEHLCSSEPSHGYGDHDFSLNFIEFRDSGEPFDPTQLPAALAQLRDAGAKNSGKTIVFIYIHGWHNGADERPQADSADCGAHLYDGDVAKFRNCGLKVIAANYPPSSSGAPPRVVGIYLAWHGTDFGWPPFSYVPSYPIRRGFARHVGLKGMAEALESIFSTIQENRDSYFVIAMGHSFGARVLEAADEFKHPSGEGDHPAGEEKPPAAGIMTKVRLHVSSPAYNQKKDDKLPVDLIFYVNAATSHFISRRTIAEWGAACKKDTSTPGCGPRPLYLAVSSRADVLTAIVMPIANIAFFWFPTDRYHIISAANTPWMQTHSIPRKVDGSESLPEYAFCFAIPTSPTQNDFYEVDPKKGRVPAIFWDMNTDHWDASLLEILHVIPGLRQMTNRHWVISSHGDVWNTGVFNMVYAVIDSERARADQEQVTCGPQRTNSQTPAVALRK
jgi:hypothetical protein